MADPCGGELKNRAGGGAGAGDAEYHQTQVQH